MRTQLIFGPHKCNLENNLKPIIYLQWKVSVFWSRLIRASGQLRWACSPWPWATVADGRLVWCSRTFSWTPSNSWVSRLCWPYLPRRWSCNRLARPAGYFCRLPMDPWWLSAVPRGICRLLCVRFLSFLKQENFSQWHNYLLCIKIKLEIR